MTVKELKEYLDQFDDEAPISVCADDGLDYRLSRNDIQFHSPSGEVFIYCDREYI